MCCLQLTATFIIITDNFSLLRITYESSNFIVSLDLELVISGPLAFCLIFSGSVHPPGPALDASVRPSAARSFYPAFVPTAGGTKVFGCVKAQWSVPRSACTAASPPEQATGDVENARAIGQVSAEMARCA